jgi:hypothetical protein
MQATEQYVLELIHLSHNPLPYASMFTLLLLCISLLHMNIQ